MAEDEQLNQTDFVVVEIMALILGGAVIRDEQTQAGLDEAMQHLVQTFAGRNQKKAAALVEHIRRKATDNRSDPALINILRKRPPGSGQPN